jgi:hypothetical protein
MNAATNRRRSINVREGHQYATGSGLLEEQLFYGPSSFMGRVRGRNCRTSRETAAVAFFAITALSPV